MEPATILPAYAEELDLHENIKVISQSPDKMVYQINCVDGLGTVEVMTLFPGVIMQFHSFHCKSFRLTGMGEIGDGLKISYCSEGRMEVRMSDNRLLFMEPGILSLYVNKAQDSFQFPCGHYHGVELFLHASSMAIESPEIWRSYEISMETIQNRFCPEGRNYAIRAEDRLKALFQAMLDAPEECQMNYLRIKATELLFLLCAAQMPDKSDNYSFMTMGQVEIAKQIMSIITLDLGQHYSIESLAESFGISPTSAKNYFQGVYGKNISGYLREARMSAATLALRDSQQPIAEIASAVGYENASKFSAAFKNFFSEAPLEYRRQSRCGI